MKCDICKEVEAKYMVVLVDTDTTYQYQSTHRCDACTERAKRSHENIEITELK